MKNHHHNQNTQYSHPSPQISLCSFAVFPFLHPQATTDLLLVPKEPASCAAQSKKKFERKGVVN